MDNITHLFRYERGGVYNSEGTVDLCKFKIVKETPSGYWIDTWGRKKFVLKHSQMSKKRYAYPTPDLAWENFVIRTRKCVWHLEIQLKAAQLYLKAERPEKARGQVLTIEN